MNPVLMLARNNLDLTKRATASVQAQDIPTDLLLLDNDSRDGTLNWAQEQNFHVVAFRPQLGVSAAWNWGLDYLFADDEAAHVLVVNNDVVLPPWYYRYLLACELPLVSGCAVESRDAQMQEPELATFAPQPDFSAFLITRECWGRIGKFDERMALYASDCDYNVRCCTAGLVTMHARQLLYYHERSSTIVKAAEWERNEIQKQADRDRETFRLIWGFPIGGPEYKAIVNKSS